MEEAIIPVFGMERILPAPNGQRLNLTDFQLPKDQRHALVSQGALWSYFDRFLHVPSKVPPKAKEKSKLNKENGKKVVKKTPSKSRELFYTMNSWPRTIFMIPSTTVNCLKHRSRESQLNSQ